METVIPFPSSSARWIALFNGIVQSALGTIYISEGDQATSFRFFAGCILLAVGLCMILFWLFLFFRVTSWIPGVQMDTNGVSIREKFLSSRSRIAWKDINGIEYGPYQVSFKLTNNNKQVFNLDTEAQNSIAIKKAIREFAESRRIPVSGG